MFYSYKQINWKFDSVRNQKRVNHQEILIINLKKLNNIFN